MAAKNPSVYERRIASLFSDLSVLCPPDDPFVAQLHKRARMRQTGWKKALDGYLAGLLASGHLWPGARDYLWNLARCCPEAAPLLREIGLGFLGVLALAAMAALSHYQSVPPVQLDFVVMALLTVGAARGATSPWVDSHGSVTATQQRVALAILGAFTATAIGLFVPWLTWLGLQEFSIDAFKAQREQMLKDPAGFARLDRFARDNYDVQVLLGEAEDSWAMTTIAVPNASPASMQLGQGYCQLNLNAHTLRATFGARSAAYQAAWTEGVLMHEFGHCLDMRRDLAQADHYRVYTHSIAPVDRKDVVDLSTWMSATDRPTTQLWREALADIFAVGYWRLTFSQAAPTLHADLRRKRVGDASSDPTHSTSCWLRYAMSAEPPTSPHDLLIWADAQRDKAPCHVDGTRLTQWDRLKQAVAGWLKR